MLAKKTVKNQITLPKAIIQRFPDVDYFDVSEENGRIVLAPIKPSKADAVRAKLRELGIDNDDVQAAIDWAKR